MALNHFRDRLAEEGYQLALEIRDGKWNALPGIERPASSPGVIDELRSRCPGFTNGEYAKAIADGLYSSK